MFHSSVTRLRDDTCDCQVQSTESFWVNIYSSSLHSDWHNVAKLINLMEIFYKIRLEADGWWKWPPLEFENFRENFILLTSIFKKNWQCKMFWNFLSHPNKITRNYHDRCIIKFKSRFEGWKMFSNQNFHQIEI